MTLRKGFARHKAIKGSELSSIAWRDQRVGSVARHPFCGDSAWHAETPPALKLLAELIILTSA